MRRADRSGAAFLALFLGAAVLVNCSDDKPARVSAKPGMIATIAEKIAQRTPNVLRVGPDDAVYIGGDGAAYRYPVKGTDDVFYRSTDDAAVISGLAFGRGLVFLTEADDGTVRGVKPNGSIINVAGNGRFGRPTDGEPAAHSPLLCPAALAYSEKLDALLIRDGIEIRTVDTKGLIGSAVRLDQLSPTDACSTYVIRGLATDADGWYWSSVGRSITRALPPDHQTYPADPNASPPAFDQIVDYVYDKSSNSVFVADKNRVRRVTRDGTITVVAGNGDDKVSGDGRRAVEAGLGEVISLDLDSQGNLYILAGSPASLRVVGGPVDGKVK